MGDSAIFLRLNNTVRSIGGRNTKSYYQAQKGRRVRGRSLALYGIIRLYFNDRVARISAPDVRAYYQIFL